MKTKMKIRLAIGLMFTLCLTLWSFQFRMSTANSIDFKEALLKNLIGAVLKSTGKYNGTSIAAVLTNKGNSALTICIPAGTYFKAASEEEQNLVVAEDVFVQLSPKASSSKVIDGFCCNASKHCPTKGNGFSLSNYKVPKFDKVASLLKGKKYSPSILQDVIWSLTDDHDLSNISDENPETVRGLRQELAKITGKKNEWYDTPQKAIVDPYGNINRETVSVQGMIEFDCPSMAKVHQEIQDSVGNVLVLGKGESTLDKGAVKYYFKLQVKGWKKGTYYVKLMNGNRALVTNEFKV